MNEHAALGRDIFIIDKCQRAYLKNALKKYEITTVEAMVILALYENNGALSEQKLDNIHEFHTRKTQDQIISELQYDKAAMTRTMQQLEREGYVIRACNPNDNRSYLFSLTDKAYRFIPELLKILRTLNELLTSGVENLDIVKKATLKMAKNAKILIMGE